MTIKKFNNTILYGIYAVHYNNYSGILSSLVSNKNVSKTILFRNAHAHAHKTHLLNHYEILQVSINATPLEVSILFKVNTNI